LKSKVLIAGMYLLSICVVSVVAITVYRSVSDENTLFKVSALDVGTSPDREICASVGDSVLYKDEVVLAGLSTDEVRGWIEDELLAALAREMNLENRIFISLVRRRAEQLYLRDALLEAVYAETAFPDSEDVFEYMQTDSLLFLVERHYHRILLADSSTADSIHTRLAWGESFRLTAERISLGQKAGIGGDLGYLTGGELVLAGFPEEVGYLDGLSSVYFSEDDASIFKTSDERMIEDTMRAIYAIAPLLYESRLQTARDSLLDYALEEYPVYLDSTMILEDGS